MKIIFKRRVLFLVFALIADAKHKTQRGNDIMNHNTATAQILKKSAALLLAAALLSACANLNPTENSSSETSSSAPDVTSAPQITDADIPEETQPITLHVDIDNDGRVEELRLFPDPENDNSVLYCYDSSGNKLESYLSSADWPRQMTELTLNWYDDGETLYPILHSTYSNDFFYGEYVVRLRILDGVFRTDRLLLMSGLRENYGPINDYDYYSDICEDWISKERYDSILASVYVNKTDAPSYKRSVTIKTAAKFLSDNGITTYSDTAKYADVNEDDTDEILFTGKNKDGEQHLYCVFLPDGKPADFAQCKGFDGEEYELQWFRNSKFSYPVARITTDADDRLYKLFYVNGEFFGDLVARRHITSDGSAEFTMSDGEKEVPISESYYLTMCHDTWTKKEGRMAYSVENAADYNTKGILRDFNGDGFPELITAYGNGTYLDEEINVSRLDTPYVQSIGGMYSDADGTLCLYYDEESKEYFVISEHESYGITCTYSTSVYKTTFYIDGSHEECIASESYYFTGYEQETDTYQKLYLTDSSFMDEKLSEGRFVKSGDLRLYGDKLEKYLSRFTLVDTINVKNLTEIKSENIREDYEKQAHEIEENFFACPKACAVLKKTPTIRFNGEDIDVTAEHIEIDVSHGFESSEIKKLSEFKNLDSLYIGDDVTDSGKTDNYFDLDLLLPYADKITNLSFSNVKIDCSKLQNFKNITSLFVYYADIDLIEIGKLKSITSLGLDYYNYETEADLSPLSGMTQLKTLGFSGNLKNFDFTKDMSELQTVSFYGRSDNIDCFNTLASLPKLQVIELNGFSPPLLEHQLDCFDGRDDIIIPYFK